MKRSSRIKGTPIPASGLSDSQNISADDSFESASMEGSEYAHEVSQPQHPSAPAIVPGVPFVDLQQHLPSSTTPQDDTGNLVRNIASYLTLADAASFASLGDLQPRPAYRPSPVRDHATTTDDWAVGTEISTSVSSGLTMHPSWTSLATPATPGLIALSPIEYDPAERDEDELSHATDPWQQERTRKRLERRTKHWVQRKLTVAVLSHPQSIRSYCLEAHNAATEIQKARQHIPEETDEPETELPRENLMLARGRRRASKRRLQIFHMLVDTLLNNVPLSVMLDLAEASLETGLDTTFSVIKISGSSINAIVSTCIRLAQQIWDIVTNLNPFAVLDAIISLQFDAMGRTSEALASGIQSVATGVGSASNIALQRLSRSGGDRMSSSSLYTHGMGRRSTNEILKKKLMRKLSDINDAAELVAYSERDDDGLTRTAKKRVQKMMHYDVSLRPFTATVVIPTSPDEEDDLFGNVDFSGSKLEERVASSPREKGKLSPPSSASSSPLSPFMCTPKSFPPTPGARSLVMSRGHRFTEDVVFFARDQLRIEGGLESKNERTRAMAQALQKGSRFAVFNAADVSNGISLTCGQHVATKVGNVLYCSTRSMVPVLRNCFVYFEMSVLSPTSRDNLGVQGSMMATLSIGLSTLEMPLNTLVGAWKSSVGFCSTGQILTAGQWVSPSDLSLCCYGDSSTVGCLVCLDDSSAFETWDGIMATASVTFNVNSFVVSPPAGASSILAAPGALPTPTIPPETMPSQARALHDPLLPVLPLLVPMEEELFPTLTLHSPSTQVMCRFSKEDMLAASRESVGAPPGATVYAIDGSVLFDIAES